MTAYNFVVRGTPATQGSKRGIAFQGKVRMIESAGEKLKLWRNSIAVAAQDAIGEEPMMDGPIEIWLSFWVPKPKSGMSKQKRTVLRWPTKRGLDIDKAARAVLDGLTGVLFQDDSQVCSLRAIKCFDDDKMGVGVSVTQLPGEWW